jgi:hypothetical protein
MTNLFNSNINLFDPNLTFQQVQAEINGDLMKAYQIENILNNVGLQHFAFLGCFPADKLPEIKNYAYPVCFIANTSISTRPGCHWVAFLQPTPNSLEYFSSLGEGFHIHPLFVNFIRNYLRPPTTTFNMNLVQRIEGDNCGQFCIEFIVRRDSGESFNKIMNNFSTNLRANEIRTVQFVRDLYRTIQPRSVEEAATAWDARMRMTVPSSNNEPDR